MTHPFSRPASGTAPAQLAVMWLLFVLVPACMLVYTVLHAPMHLQWAVVPAVLFLAGQFLRAVRLWIILQDRVFSFTSVLRLHALAFSAANFFPFPAKEILTVFLIWRQKRQAVYDGILAVVYARLFDFIILSVVVIVLVVSGYKNATLVVGGFVIVVLLLLTGVFLLPGIIDSVNRNLAVRSTHNAALPVITVLMGIKRGYFRMRLQNLEKGFVVLLLSALAWAAEVVAVGIPLRVVIGDNVLQWWRFMIDNLVAMQLAASPLSIAVYYPLFIVFWAVALGSNKKVFFNAVSRSV